MNFKLINEQIKKIKSLHETYSKHDYINSNGYKICKTCLNTNIEDLDMFFIKACNMDIDKTLLAAYMFDLITKTNYRISKRFLIRLYRYQQCQEIIKMVLSEIEIWLPKLYSKLTT